MRSSSGAYKALRSARTVGVWVVLGVTAADRLVLAIAAAGAGREILGGTYLQFVAAVGAPVKCFNLLFLPVDEH